MPGTRDSVDASDLNRRIQIQSLARTANGDGTFAETWTTIYTCWANIQNPAKGRGLVRQFVVSHLSWNLTTIIQIRFQKTTVITDGMRVYYPAHGVNHIYKIMGIENPNEANVSMWLLCQEIQAQAVN